MPRRTDIKSVLLIGSGPIVIGQACEFDYSGTQACQVLRREGFHVSLFDGTLQGFALTDKPAFCFQGHPEASPGPHDMTYLFDRFIRLMERRGG